MKIIVGIDNTERLKGIQLKLIAFTSFLEEHPEWVGKVVLIQVRTVLPLALR